MATHEITDQGVVFTETWRSVSGATGVSVDSAGLTIQAAPSNATVNLGTVAGAVDSTESVVVTIPGGERAVRTLKLNGFSRPDGDRNVAIWDSDDLDEKLSVALIPPGSSAAGAPVHVVPSVKARGAIPRQYTGASFSGRVLTLPFLRAAKLELTRVRNDLPEDFDTQPFSLTSIEASIAPHPEGLKVTGPDGALLFSMPGPFGPSVSPATIDLRVPLELALSAALVAGGELSASFTVDAEVDGQIRATSIASSGSVVRAFDEAVWIDVAGAPTTAALPGAELDQRAPTEVSADVTIVYEGLRLHPLSSPIPPAIGALEGRVVGAEPELAVLPPAALRGEQLGRIGIVGRAVGKTDLTVRIVSVIGGAAGEPIGEPGVVSLAPPRGDGGDRPEVVWVDLDPATIDGPVGVTVAATRGAFRWVDQDGPTLLLAVVDDDPGGRPVQLGDVTVAVNEQKQTLVGLDLGGAAFAGTAPVLTSELFCRVQLAHLELRYLP